jgi:hypothetical protein
LGGTDLAYRYQFYVVQAAELKVLDETTFGEPVFIRASAEGGM